MKISDLEVLIDEAMHVKLIVLTECCTMVCSLPLLPQQRRMHSWPCSTVKYIYQDLQECRGVRLLVLNSSSRCKCMVIFTNGTLDSRRKRRWHGTWVLQATWTLRERIRLRRHWGQKRHNTSQDRLQIRKQKSKTFTVNVSVYTETDTTGGR